MTGEHVAVQNIAVVEGEVGVIEHASVPLFFPHTYEVLLVNGHNDGQCPCHIQWHVTVREECNVRLFIYHPTSLSHWDPSHE